MKIPTCRWPSCDRLQATLRNSAGRVRRREVSNECTSRIRILSTCGDARREHSDPLNLARQRTSIIYTLDGKQLANLLKADLCLATRNYGTDSLALDSLTLWRNLIGNPEP